MAQLTILQNLATFVFWCASSVIVSILTLSWPLLFPLDYPRFLRLMQLVMGLVFAFGNVFFVLNSDENGQLLVYIVAQSLAVSDEFIT